MTHVKFMVAATLGENLRPPIPKWSNGQLLLPIGKPRAVDNMASMFWVWHFKRSICVCWAVIGSDAAKNIFNVTIYKTLKWTEVTTLKLLLSTETLVRLNVRVGGRKFVKMQLLPRVIGLWRGRLLRTIHIRWGGLRTAVWKALSYFVENCSVTAKLHLRDENIFEVWVILFPKINRFIF